MSEFFEEAGESFDRSTNDPEADRRSYLPVSEWDADDTLPANYLCHELIGHFEEHRLVECLRQSDLDPEADRDRPRLRCLDCQQESGDPQDTESFLDACPDPNR